MAGPGPCIILAGGIGSRLRPAIADLPKCLAPVGGRSFIALLVERLQAQGVEDFVFSLGYRAQTVERALGAIRPAPAFRCVVEKQPLGTGGAMLWAMTQAGAAEALVANGDTWLSGDLSGLFAPLDVGGGERVRLAAVGVPDRGRYGGVDVERGRVVRFTEKDASGPGLINAGFYRVSAAAFGARPPGSAFSFETDVLAGLAAQGGVGGRVVNGDFTDIGVPEDYYRFCAAMS